MKKPFIILAILLLITGCSLVKKSSPSDDKPAAYLFETDSYSLTLPSDYGLESGEETDLITPKKKDNFPSITLSLAASDEILTAKDILADAEETVENLCGQTEGCGGIIDDETINLNGKPAVKFTIHYKGRRADDPQGYINEYYYSVPNMKGGEETEYSIFQFSISASDLENPDEQKQKFDGIMGTIVFK